MKKFGGTILAIGVLLAGFLNVFFPLAASAACANTSTFGAVRLNVPKLPSKGNYVAWVRLQSPQKTGKVLVELNQAECLEVGSTTLGPNTWTWVDYQEKGTSRYITIDNIEGNSIKLIGIQASVKVDRVILAPPGCKPEEFGNNCSSVEATVFNKTDVAELPPPTDDVVSGNIKLSNTPFTQKANISSLSYSANGRVVQSADKAVPFDTTKLSNGKYTILIETKLNDGTVLRESTIITINNPENVLTPVVRWLQQYKQSFVVVGIVLGSFVGAFAFLAYLKRTYIKRRERHFHGF